MHPLMLELLPWVRQGYCCSQLLMLLVLRERGGENPELVRAMHGLCHGIGQSGGPCGLLTGGACALALLAGRGADQEQAHPYLTPLLNDYAEWFYARTTGYGGHSCSCVAPGLARDAGHAPAGQGEDALPDPMLCGSLLAECWDRLVELCAEYELDLT